MSLEYLVIPDSKDAVKDKHGSCEKDSEPLSEAPHWPKTEQTEHQ